jgi:hypothetical protein
MAKGLISVKGYIPWVGRVKRKIFGGIVVGEYQWVVGFRAVNGLRETTLFCGLLAPTWGGLLLRFGIPSLWLGGMYIPSSWLHNYY